METKNGNMMNAVYISQINCITPLGFDVQTNIEAVLEGKSAIVKSDKYPLFPDVLLGEISDEEINIRFEKISTESNFSRLEKLMILALYPILKDKNIDRKSTRLNSSHVKIS